MRNFLLSALTAAATLAASAQYADPYKVIYPLSAELNGTVAYLMNYDTGLAVDSATVADGSALFKGTVDEPYVAVINVNETHSPVFILEEGTIAFSKETPMAFGSPLNDRFREINDTELGYVEQFRNSTSDEERETIYHNYLQFVTKTMNENIDNPIGYLCLLELSSEMAPAEFDAVLKKNPDLEKNVKIKELAESNRLRLATSPGAKYVDFEVDGKKLSDYVGADGKYLLVDFFASWCGPCIRQLPVLKELYAAYPDKLNVLGVAVWDDPEASERAIEQHELPWPCIINAQTIPTDIYGITGIPCIMLISPDGTILIRDLQGDELKEAVAAALNS